MRKCKVAKNKQTDTHTQKKQTFKHRADMGTVAMSNHGMKYNN